MKTHQRQRWRPPPPRLDWTDANWWAVDPAVLYKPDRNGRLLSPELLTHDMIKVLRVDAAKVADDALMSMCEDALNHVTDAWNCCADLIAMRQRKTRDGAHTG